MKQVLLLPEVHFYTILQYITLLPQIVRSSVQAALAPCCKRPADDWESSTGSFPRRFIDLLS